MDEERDPIPKQIDCEKKDWSKSENWAFKFEGKMGALKSIKVQLTENGL